jgi:hypothetical protein
MTEVWKQIIIESIPCNYEISDLGNVRNSNTLKLLSLSKSGRYVTCWLKNGENRGSNIVHCLVAEAFVPNDDPTKTYVNHINHDKHDNRAINLEWSTHSENVKHSYTNENRVLLGQVVNKHDVNTNDIIKEYKSKSEACRDLNVHHSTIDRMIRTKDTKRGYYLTFKTQPIPKQIVTDLTGFIPVQNYENYMINPEGKVYSKYTQILLKPRFNTYYYVCLNNDNQAIHRLVAIQFLPNPENKKFVNHKDGNKLNNHVDNLEWSTIAENGQHAHDTGLNPTSIAIKQYTLDGKLVNTFNSITNACKHLGIETHCVSEITRCCDKLIKYAYNFIWRYEHDNSIVEPVFKQDYMVGQFTMDGIFIRGFKTLSDAAVAMGKHKRNTRYISLCFFGYVSNMYGYKWKPI